MYQNASNEIMRRHQSRLPPVYVARNLFYTPGAGTSNPPEIYQAAAPGARNLFRTPGAGSSNPPEIYRAAAPGALNTAPPQHVPTPPGHYSNPLENMIVAAARLATLPMDGDSPIVVETRRVRELLQTTLVQQEAYSYSRDRIHSNPRPSRSYSRRMDSPAVSSNAQRRVQLRGHDLARNGALHLVY